MIFVDTSAWVALTLSEDRNAVKAKAFYREISKGVYGAIVTTDFILDESVTFVRMEADVSTAARLARTLLSSANLSLLWIDSAQFEGALQLFEGHEDERWSFTDCTSFVVMRELGIAHAFTFDRNFAEAGFTRLP